LKSSPQARGKPEEGDQSPSNLPSSRCEVVAAPLDEVALAEDDVALAEDTVTLLGAGVMEAAVVDDSRGTVKIEVSEAPESAVTYTRSTFNSHENGKFSLHTPQPCHKSMFVRAADREKQVMLPSYSQTDAAVRNSGMQSQLLNCAACDAAGNWV
jgi:lysine/ornithine N-monooxygenase